MAAQPPPPPPTPPPPALRFGRWSLVEWDGIILSTSRGDMDTLGLGVTTSRMDKDHMGTQTILSSRNSSHCSSNNMPDGDDDDDHVDNDKNDEVQEEKAKQDIALACACAHANALATKTAPSPKSTPMPPVAAVSPQPSRSWADRVSASGPPRKSPAPRLPPPPRPPNQHHHHADEDPSASGALGTRNRAADGGGGGGEIAGAARRGPRSTPQSPPRHTSAGAPGGAQARRPRTGDLLADRLKRTGVAGYRKSALPPMRPRGLVNSGNTCFVNVVLQALLACVPFRRLLLAAQDLPTLPPLLARFVRLAVDMSAAPPPAAASCVGATSSSRVAGTALPSSCNAVSASSPSPQTLSSGAPHATSRAPLAVHPIPLRPDWFDDVFPGSAVRTHRKANGDPPLSAAGSSSALAAMRARPASQEDAEEFLTFILNQLHEELIAECPVGMASGANGGKRHANGSLGSAHHDHRGPEDRSHAGHTANYAGAANGSAWTGAAVARDSSMPSSPDSMSVDMGLRGGGDGPANGFLIANGYGHDHARGEDGVWEEITSKGKTVEVRNADLVQSPITGIFGGVLRSELRRPSVKVSVTREPFLSLSLDIDSGLVRDVEASLTAYFEPERLEGYTLESSSEAVDARKQVLLEGLPEVLVLHLKRFSHNAQTGALTKVTRRMDFPEHLEIPCALLSSAKVAPMVRDRMYELTAVVTHIGKELAGGHYTCDVRVASGSGLEERGMHGDLSPSSSSSSSSSEVVEDGKSVGEQEDQKGKGMGCATWVSCDDSKVSVIPLQTVLRRQAYLLFYSKVRCR